MVPNALKSRALSLANGGAAGDLLATFGARLVQMLLGLVGNVLAARALGPVDLGRFGLVLATVTICGTLADGGLTYTAVKLIARYNDEEGGRARIAAGAYGLMRLGTGAAVGILGFLLAMPISSFLLGYPDLTPYMQLGFCTLFSLAVSSYPGAVLVGLGRFGKLAVAGILNAFITLSGIVVLWALGRLDLGTLIAWNVALPLVSTLPAWAMLPREWLPWRIEWRRAQPSLRHEVHREIVGFSKWMGVSLLASIIVAQGDILLLGRLSTPAVVGVYAVALTLATRLDTLNQSLYTVMMPRASRLQTSSQMRRYVRRVTSGSIILAAILGVLALFAQPLITLLYGESYAAASGLFLALLLIVLFDLATSSLFLLAFPLNKPRLLALADWLRVGVLGLAGWLLIPAFAALGAVAARFLAKVAGTAWTLVALRRAIGSMPPDGSGGTDAEVGTASEPVL